MSNPKPFFAGLKGYQFPLFHLPYSALQEVLRSLTPIEIFKLSCSSKKSALCTPCAGIRHLTLYLDFANGEIHLNTIFKFKIFSAFDPLKTEKFFTKRNVSLNNDENEICVLCYLQENSDNEWINKVAAMKKMVLRLKDIFIAKLRTLSCNFTLPGTHCRSMIYGFMKKQEATIRNLQLAGVLEDEDLRWILENVIVTGTLKVRMNVREDFTANFKPICGYLDISLAKWITVDRLLTFNSCAFISVGSAPELFTRKDLECLINAWKSGHLPKLEFLKLENINLNEEDNIMNFKRGQLQATKTVQRFKHFDNVYVSYCDGGVDVQANDGTCASIQWNANTEFFQLFVWES